MSEEDEELELQALQRELDDAFATTRPRTGFEDELWLRMQARRPVSTRFRDAFAGLLGGIREVPRVPAVAVAAVLLIAVSIGVYSAGLRGGGGAGTTAGLSAPAGGDQSSGRNQYSPGAFGRLPAPSVSKSGEAGPVLSASEYAGPARYVWAGKLDVTIASAPVFRYAEPSTSVADQFAATLGAALSARPQGFLGTYVASSYTLDVRGTTQAPPASPAYFILANVSMPVINAAGASPEDLANIFLAQHLLAPQWTYTVAVDSSGNPVRVVYQRVFTVPGAGGAHLVDSNGAAYGLEVDLIGGQPVFVSGLLPVSLDVAEYRTISGDQAIRLATSQDVSGTVTSPPTVQLTKAELVYVLVPAGDHSFYEPAFLFSGTVQVNGVTMTRHVLVPAVDPSQRMS